MKIKYTDLLIFILTAVAWSVIVQILSIQTVVASIVGIYTVITITAIRKWEWKTVFWKKLLYMCYAPLICFLLVEFSLRLHGQHYSNAERVGTRFFTPYEFMLNDGYFKFKSEAELLYESSGEFSYRMKANSIGIVDDEVDTCDRRTTYLFLGDSFTMGLGAAMGESFVHILRGGLSDTIRIVNAGIAGSNPLYQTELFEYLLGLGISPTRVFVCLHQSDIEDVVLKGPQPSFQEPWFTEIYRHLHLVRYVVHGVLRRDHYFLLAGQLDRAVNQQRSRVSTQLRDFEVRLRGLGIQLVILALPERVDCEIGSSQILTDLSIGELEVLDLAKSIECDSTFWWRKDRHPTQKGYAELSEKILGIGQCRGWW